MKKYVRVFLIIIIFFLIINFILHFFSNEKVVSYKIDEFNVNEYYLKKNDKYYVEVNKGNNIFNFIIDNNFNKKSYVIDKFYSFENASYTCILPVFMDGNVYTDILCLYDNVIYTYRNLVNKSLELDRFANEMEEYGYKIKLEQLDIQNKNNITIYNGNLKSSHIIVVPSYTGIYLINSGDEVIKTIDLFNKDIYKQSLNCLVSDYYLVADYNQAYSFHEFYLINLKNNKVSTVASNTAISMNSYIQGVVGDSVYIIDRSNKKQYVVNVSNKSVSVIGNVKKGIQYYDDEQFVNKSIHDAIKEDMLFKSNYIDSNKYDYVYNNNGIYYSYLKVKDGYDIYISYEKLPDVYSYGTKVSDISNINYSSDYIYYIDKDCLYRYSLNDGTSTLLKYSEFLYNDKLDFYIYEK